MQPLQRVVVILASDEGIENNTQGLEGETLSCIGLPNNQDIDAFEAAEA